jgi:RNA polymerase sigma-70 factor (ECF subfamily)
VNPSQAAHFPVSKSLLAHPIPAVKADAGHRSWQTRSPSDEQQLIEQLRRGERAALERMIVEHRELVTGLVARLTGWTNDTDDLVQDVFVAALNGVKKFRGGSRISTWLTRIAINVCRSHHRTRLVRLTFWKRWMTQASEPTPIDASEPAQERERSQQVTEAIRRLSARHREVLVLHYLQGMPNEEIQKALGLSRNAVEVRLHRARQKLHEILKPMMDASEPQ